jgi:urease accessory protein
MIPKSGNRFSDRIMLKKNVKPLAVEAATRSYSLAGSLNRGPPMNPCARRIATAAAIVVALTGAASAHPGHSDATGFAHGFAHPLGGLDHVLAMVAVGLYAALLGGRALWLLPAAFIAMMAFGGVLGAAGFALPYTEIGIALSVVVLGLAIALRINLPTLAAMALAGLFAVFHGHAHGAEMPDASGYTYAAGFMLTTALLHCAGIALGLAAGRLGGLRIAQAAGGAMAIAGVALLAGAA